MQISKTAQYIVPNVYVYDIPACFPNLLTRMGWDTNELFKLHKLQRNIKIGLLQKEYPELSKLLLQQTEDFLNCLIEANNLSRFDILVHQRDGIIVSKKLSVIEAGGVVLKLRYSASFFILNASRNAFLLLNCFNHDEGRKEPFIAKGIRNRTVDQSYFALFNKLNFMNKKTLMRTLNTIRTEILNSDNVKWFLYPTKREKEYNMVLIDGTIIRLNESMCDMIDTSEINKQYVWEKNIWPFAEGIFLHTQLKRTPRIRKWRGGL